MVPFAGFRRGENRIKIIDFLKKRPYNTNQLANVLGVQHYKLVQHHTDVLEGNNMVIKAGEKYGVFYFISNYLESNIGLFNEIKATIQRGRINLDKSK